MRLLNFIFFALISFTLQSQTLFWQDNFDGTGPNMGGGDRDAPNHTDGDNGSDTGICGAGDYFFRTNLANDPGNGVSISFSGFSGSYWRGEDLDGCVGGNPDVLDFTGISITGRTGMQFNGSFGANPSISWEDSDFIRVEYSIDGASFTTGIIFESDDSANGGANGVLKEDTDTDGTGDGATTLSGILNAFSFAIPGTGTTLALKVTVSANGGGEEFAFEGFEVVEGVAAPVTFSAFTAKAGSNNILLQWQTSSEENNSHFQIERSINGRDFHPLGQVEGNGTTTNTSHYNFNDNQPKPGTNYYRLKQIDYDESFDYSSIIDAKTEGISTQTTINPNPFRNHININFAEELAEDAIYQLYDINGRLIQKGQLSMGSKTEELDVSILHPGTYLLQIIAGESVSNHRIIKN